MYHAQNTINHAYMSFRLRSLCDLWHLQLSAKYAVPETAGDAEAVVIVGKVVLQVVLLEVAVV